MAPPAPVFYFCSGSGSSSCYFWEVASDPAPNGKKHEDPCGSGSPYPAKNYSSQFFLISDDLFQASGLQRINEINMLLRERNQNEKTVEVTVQKEELFNNAKERR